MVRPMIRALIAVYRLEGNDDTWYREVTHAYADLESRLRGRKRRAFVLGEVAKHIEQARKLRAMISSESLREAIRAGVRDPQDKLRVEGAWNLIASGRYVVFDRLVVDNRVYLVACRGDDTDPRALSQRECAIAHAIATGQSNKLIAYELGVSESTVGSHLSSALLKLRLGSRSELIQLLQPTS